MQYSILIFFVNTNLLQQASPSSLFHQKYNLPHSATGTRSDTKQQIQPESSAAYRIWINLRLNFSKCMIAKNREEAIINFERFAKKENLWFIWYKLSYACLVFGKVDESLLYGSKCYISVSLLMTVKVRRC